MPADRIVPQAGGVRLYTPHIRPQPGFSDGLSQLTRALEVNVLGPAEKERDAQAKSEIEKQLLLDDALEWRDVVANNPKLRGLNPWAERYYNSQRGAAQARRQAAAARVEIATDSATFESLEATQKRLHEIRDGLLTGNENADYLAGFRSEWDATAADIMQRSANARIDAMERNATNVIGEVTESALELGLTDGDYANLGATIQGSQRAASGAALDTDAQEGVIVDSVAAFLIQNPEEADLVLPEIDKLVKSSANRGRLAVIRQQAIRDLEHAEDRRYTLSERKRDADLRDLMGKISKSAAEGTFPEDLRQQALDFGLVTDVARITNIIENQALVQEDPRVRAEFSTDVALGPLNVDMPARLFNAGKAGTLKWDTVRSLSSTWAERQRNDGPASTHEYRVAMGNLEEALREEDPQVRSEIQQTASIEMTAYAEQNPKIRGSSLLKEFARITGEVRDRTEKRVYGEQKPKAKTQRLAEVSAEIEELDAKITEVEDAIITGGATGARSQFTPGLPSDLEIRLSSRLRDLQRRRTSALRRQHQIEFPFPVDQRTIEQNPALRIWLESNEDLLTEEVQ